MGSLEKELTDVPATPELKSQRQTPFMHGLPVTLRMGSNCPGKIWTSTGGSVENRTSRAWL